MATTFSCRTAAADRASRRNRLRAGEVAASSGAITLIATTRCSISSNAFEHDAEAAAAENLQDLVMPETGPASRVCPTAPEGSGALDIFAALVVWRLGQRAVLARDRR